MKRKLLVVFAGIFCFLVIGFNPAMAAGNHDNPIDQAFAKDFNEAMSTVEMNYVAEEYMQAWKAEMNNAAAVIKQQYKFDEDKARVDAYVAAYEQVADAAVYLEWLNWSDTEESPDCRSFGTGAPSASWTAKANIYKQATLNLLKAYQHHAVDKPYTYAYTGKGADLVKMRAER